ncbi:MAG: ABC transporter ATP-binding protein [Lachnospiraceae bacterium]|nr:ABC transporter ATP-binding protein [Lachnospiraceae bacterium]
MNKIEIDHLSLNYVEKKGSFTALSDVSFSIQEGEFVSIIGASGCGKSTLLSVLEGLNRPSSGTVKINGEPVKGCGIDRGVVFQQYSLFPWMTARNNVAFGIKQSRKELSRRERLQLADAYLKKVGLENIQDKYPGQLSGGMQQRVAIARALAMDTDILLMDEPFGAIDPKNRTALWDLLLDLWETDSEKKKTVLFVTHDIDEAIFLSDRIILMDASPGRVLAEIEVPFRRPRVRTELLASKEYSFFKNNLLNVFYNETEEAGEEIHHLEKIAL